MRALLHSTGCVMTTETIPGGKAVTLPPGIGIIWLIMPNFHYREKYGVASRPTPRHNYDYAETLT